MSLLTAWLASPPPDAAVEISLERVSAAVVSRRGFTATVQAYAVQPLPVGAVAASLTSQNIVDRAAVVAALRSVLGSLGTRPARIALVIPDVTARISLVKFDQVPARREDLDQLVRWQIRKSAPFPIEEACIAYTPAGGRVSAAEFLVALARRDVIREYESVCDEAGVYAGLVDIATLSVVNLFLASDGVPAGDWLLVHMRPEHTSLVIMRDEAVMFFRNGAEGEEGSLADRVHQTAMYYQDRLAGQGFTRVLLGGSGQTAGALDAARRGLEERLGVPVEAIDPTRAAALTNRIAATGDLADILSPLVGVLLRTQREAVTA
ncbi:MAG: pilus assembly protein PilM [Vicinamibacterales bacterium]